MKSLADLPISQLHRIISIKEQIEALQGQIESIAGGSDGTGVFTPFTETAPKKRRMSAAVRARIAAAQRARWARIKGTGATVSKPAKKRDRRSSPAVRAKLAAAARARWKKAKAAGKKTL